MPFLDIGISQPCSGFRNSFLSFRCETNFHNKIVVGNDRRLASIFSSKPFCIREKGGKSVTLGRAESLMIKAVGTLEIASVPCKNVVVNGYRDVLRMDADSIKSTSFEPQSSSEDSMEVNEREKLRRMRISKANKGNTPWNKGKKHSPETLRRIKERTRLAMQNPKVKMKLMNLGHAQSEETKMKIGVGVRLGWERRRQRLMLQDSCLFEWQNLIAVASRKGLVGEEELRWDSFQIMDKKLEQEWLQSVEQRKNSQRPKGGKKAPKSAEQKRKISEAIAAKWADPEYRERVWSGLARFHGIVEGADRKPRRKPAGDGQTRKQSLEKKDETDDLAKRRTKIQNQLIRQKRNRTPSYKDPLASSKLEMLKNIRAQRAAAVNKKCEAITRAKLMIAEAEKAAGALEIAAQTCRLAQASLIESRMLIAEANRLIASLEIEDATVPDEDSTIFLNNDNDLSENATVPVTNLEKETKEDAGAQNKETAETRKINGSHNLSTTLTDSTGKFSFNNFMLPDLVNGNRNGNGNGSSSCPNATLETEEKLSQMSSNSTLNNYSNSTKKVADPMPNPNGVSAHTQKPWLNGMQLKAENFNEPTKQVKMIKKWVRGRLVEVAEES